MVRVLLLIVLMPALITFIFQKIIFVEGEKQPWTYRVSFLIGFFITLYWVDIISVDPVSAIRVFGIFMGAFAGGLIATALDKGLLEKSFPPSGQIESEIRGYHKKVIENLKPVNHLKQRFDIVMALAGLFIFSPLFIFLSFLIWFEDPGPIFFIKYSTGKGGSTFSQLKFRSMIQNAEVETGPVPASMQDPRRLFIGRIIRLLRVDEIPQLFNILRGEMSFVGPRPLRAVDVHKFLIELPEFAERHTVLPGIAGLSQATVGYYVSPKDRLYYDLLYIQQQSFLFDTRLLIQSVLSIHKNRLLAVHEVDTEKIEKRLASGNPPGGDPPG